MVNGDVQIIEIAWVMELHLMVLAINWIYNFWLAYVEDEVDP